VFVLARVSQLLQEPGESVNDRILRLVGDQRKSFASENAFAPEVFRAGPVAAQVPANANVRHALIGDVRQHDDAIALLCCELRTRGLPKVPGIHSKRSPFVLFESKSTMWGESAAFTSGAVAEGRTSSRTISARTDPIRRAAKTKRSVLIFYLQAQRWPARAMARK
jgi:hypothetical protein